MSEARLLVFEDADVVCSVNIVVLCAIHEYRRGDADEEEAILLRSWVYYCSVQQRSYVLTSKAHEQPNVWLVTSARRKAPRAI